jgi:replicative DNA helicase
MTDIKNVDKILENLQQEIIRESKGLEQVESLARLKEIAKIYKGEDKVIPFSDIVARISKGEDELKIMSGWQGLDDLLRGFRLQQLVVVSAATKSGKTSFLMDMTTRFKEYNPLWFAFEESADELVRKFLERGQEPPHAYTPENITGNSIDWLDSKIVEAIAKYDTKVVFIDQLDFIVPFLGDNHHLAIAKTMRELKGLAKKWNVVIFIICHLAKVKMDTQPTMEDLRGSSSISQEADTVMLLWREAKREDGQMVITDNVNVSVQANRRFGKTGNVKMIYDNGRFIEREWMTDEQQAREDLKHF